MANYRARTAVPALVERAQALAQQRQFTRSSLPEVGRLLATLTATVGAGRVGEIGSGCGVGAAWMVEALRPGATFVTIDNDAELAAAVRALLVGYPQVQVLHDSWEALQSYGPFQLLFADGGKVKQDQPAALLDLVGVGGMIVLDDLTPEEYWPEAWRGMPDLVREFWLNSERVQATEVRVTERHAVILATRLY